MPVFLSKKQIPIIRLKKDSGIPYKIDMVSNLSPCFHKHLSISILFPVRSPHSFAAVTQSFECTYILEAFQEDLDGFPKRTGKLIDSFQPQVRGYLWRGDF